MRQEPDSAGPRHVPKSPRSRVGGPQLRARGRAGTQRGQEVADLGGCARLWSPRTSSSPAEASSAGPPARCSLRSRAASSPTGLGCVRPGARSYSTHRLLSASSAAGDPARAQASAGEPMAGGVGQVSPPPPPPPAALGLSQALWSSGHECHQPQGPRPATSPRAHTPVGLRLRLGTCTSRLLAFLVERGPGDTATVTAPCPSSRRGAASSAAGTGTCRGTGRGGSHTDPSPGEGTSIWPAGR